MLLLYKVINKIEGKFFPFYFLYNLIYRIRIIKKKEYGRTRFGWHME